jgi:DNA-binding LytR/AlgR family response regulator
MAEPVPDLRIFCADDEALALRRIQLLLDRIPGVALVGTARSGPEAVEAIRAAKPDLVLLDIRMGQMDGFAVAGAIAGPAMPLIVFVTAFDEFAVRAFEVSAVDYLVKPVEVVGLVAAIARARARIEAEDGAMRAAELQAIVEALRQSRRAAEPKRYESEIWAQRLGEFVRIRTIDIDWIEAERDYVHIHVGDRSYMLRETIGGLERRLDPAEFIRIRRSALVRAERIRSIRRAGYGDYRVQIAGDRQLRVGRTYVKTVRGRILGSATSPIED